MALAKFTMTACSPKSKHTIGGVRPFSLMLNPESINLQQSVSYVGVPSKEDVKKYVSNGEWHIRLPSIILDTTGVIPKCEWPQGDEDILGMIEHLKNVTCKYYGNEHETPLVKMQWGSFLFWARLNSISVKYTLFNHKGTPVRAEISLDFGGFKTEKESEAEKNKQSPDLTHLVEVRVGDSLPLMCNRVYNDPSLYLQVAKANNLTSFRYLKPGSKLYFPPIVD